MAHETSAAMTHENLRPKTAISLIALFIVALVLAAFHGALMLGSIGSKRDADLDSRVWLLAQIEVDHKEYRIAILKAQRSPTLSREAELEVRRAFDIYHSRILTVGVAFSLSNASASDLVYFKKLEISRDEMTVLIDGVAFLRSQDIRRLKEISIVDAVNVREVASAGIQMFTQMEEEKRIKDVNTLVRQGVLMGVLFIFMIVALALAIRASQQAARTSSNLRRTFEASLDGVVVTDDAGTITYLNTAASRMFDQAPSDLLGASIVETILPRSMENSDAGALLQVLRDGALVSLADSGRHHLTGRHRSGRMFPIEVSIVSDHDGNGRLVCIGFFRDMSTEVATEAMLRSARDKARQDAAAKSRFLAIMSHEMRTPLHGLIAALDLIDCNALSINERRFLVTARACSLSALDQVDEVLEATRDGAAEVTKSTFDPQNLLADLLASLQHLARARGNRLIFQPPSGQACPSLLGWQRGFLLIMRNLISNAIKFTSDGDIVASLRFETQPDGRIALDVEVRDSGVGIDPANYDRIFQEFEVIEDEASRAAGGVGLGLAIAGSAIQRMGSTIKLQSTLGHGSCFSFRLLMEAAPSRVPSRAPSRAPAEVADTLPVGDVTVPSPPCRHILVVDDNPVNTALMAEMLRRIGHLPETALDGPRAITLAREKVFDLILMDVGMPGMDGLETTRAIRAGGASAFCPVVGVTALLLTEDRVRILESGMQDVLAKPLGLEHLRRYLADFFAALLPTRDENEAFDDVRALMGDEMMVQLLKGVQQDAVTALTALQALEAEQDMLVLRQVLHRAAGSAAVIGALALAEALNNGERAINADDLGALKFCEAQIAQKIADLAIYSYQILPKSV